MQPSEKVTLITVKLNDETKQGFKTLEVNSNKLTKTLNTSVGGAVTKLTGGLQALVGGIGKVTFAFGAVGAAAGAAFMAIDKMAGRGGQVQQLQADFTKLANDTESAWYEMMGAIRTATNGTISNFDRLTIGNKLMSMGLAGSADEMENIVRVATRLGDQTMSVTDRVENFSLLLANQSILRLDTFGISGAKVRERIEELQEATPGLSREVAFMTATFEEAGSAMELLGDEEVTATMKFQQFKATVQNLIDSTLVMLEPIFMDIADNILPHLTESWNNFLENFDPQDLTDAIDAIKDAFKEFQLGWEEGSAATAQVTEDTKTFMIEQLDELSKELGFTGVNAEHVAENIGIAWSALKGVLVSAVNVMVGAVAWLVKVIVQAFKKIMEWKGKLDEGIETLAQSAVDNFNMMKDNIRQFKEDVVGAFQRVKEKIQEMIDKAKEAGQAVASAVTPDFLEGNKQSGGTIGRAGFYDVGEAGKERVYLPQGSKVVPNDRITNNNNNSNVTINVNESIGDPSALASIVNFYLAR